MLHHWYLKFHQLTQGLQSPELRYLLLVVGLFLVPRLLQRFKLPSAVTCFVIGALSSIGFHILHGDPTIELLGVLGIVALFLFAGMEVDLDELRSSALTLSGHLLIQSLLLVLAAGAFWYFGYLDVRAAILVGLAIVTPSTGFILDSLHSFGLTLDQRTRVKSRAIAAELLALGVLFFAVQSKDETRLLVSGAVLIVMTLALPRLFHMFVQLVLPHAPNSEFAFLVIVALVCAAITRHLGVYYLVGAFMVGITARRLGGSLPIVSSRELTRSVELFASFFIPFYFFKAGLHLAREDFSYRSIGLGILLLVVVAPIRVMLTSLPKLSALRQSIVGATRVGLSMVPTLVFTLVLANILREQFGISRVLYGALVVYAVATTLVPGFLLGAKPDFDAPRTHSLASTLEPASNQCSSDTVQSNESLP